MKKIIKIFEDINIKNLLLIFLIIQPFLDIYLKVVGEKLDIFGFSLTTLIRVIFVSVVLIYILLKKKNKKDWILVGSYLGLVAIYSIIHICSGQKFVNNYRLENVRYIITELLYILRLTLPVLLLFCLYKEGTDIKKTTKYLAITAILISLIIVITDIFKVSFVAYSLDYTMVKDNIFSWFTDGYKKFEYNELTAKGWFYEANSISALLVFTFPILLYSAMKLKKWYYYAGIQIQIVAMLMLGSRTASYGWILVYIGYIFFYLMYNGVKKRKYDYKFLIISVTIIIFSSILLNYSPIRVRQLNNEQYRASYNENVQKIEESIEGTEQYFINDIIKQVVYENGDPMLYVDAINKGIIKISDKYSHEEVKKLIENNDVNGLRRYIINEYLYTNYNTNYISEFYILKALRYDEDPEFWLNVFKMSFDTKADNRELEKLIIRRLKYNNDNTVMDTLFGLNDSVLKSRGFVVEADFYNHYYTIGVIGMIILFGPYIICLGYIGIKILRDLRNKFTMGNVMYGLAIVAALGMGYLSGHLIDEYITSLLLMYILASLMLNISEDTEGLQ